MPLFYTHNETTSPYSKELNLFLEKKPTKRNYFWEIRDSNNFLFFEIDNSGNKRSLKELLNNKNIIDLRWLPKKKRLTGIGLRIQNKQDLINLGLHRRVKARFNLSGRTKTKSEEYCISFIQDKKEITKKINNTGKISEEIR